MADNYSASIEYARINSNNTSLARSNDGDGDGSNLTINEVIASPSSSGKFVSPTTVPSGTTVVCTTDVSATFQQGQYLFYFDAAAVPILIGQIASVATTTITLTANIIGSGSSMTNRELGSSYSLITAAESFYIRVSVSPIGSSGGSAIYIPNISEWRNTPNQREQSTVKTSVSEIIQYSNTGNPLSISISPSNVQFKITTQNVFRTANNGATYFPTANELPHYIWLLATPIPSVGQSTGFSASTMYKFSTNEFMDNAITVTANTSKTVLYDAGYKIN